MNSNLRKTLSIISLVLLICMLVSCATARNVESPVFKTEVSSLEANTFTTKYGNLNTTAKATEFVNEGMFEWGDVVRVSFLGNSLELPVVPAYSYVDTGTAAIIVSKGTDGQPTGVVQLAINMGDFTTTYGIAKKTTNVDKTWYWTACDGVELPLEITFQMADKAGYMSQFLLKDLTRTNIRSDYANLSDADYANFRKVNTTGISKLYRTSNPVNAELGRNEYADRAMKDAKVTVVMNLSDDKATAEARPEFKGSYYSTCNVKYLNLGVDFSSDEFKKGLAEGLRFFATNEGVYAVHCTEGKDRAGFVSALLECLMGASAQEVADDYMRTYINYYGVEKGTEKYDAILASNIVKTIETAFGISDFYSENLAKGAEKYIKSIGLTDSEIKSLKSNLK